MGGFKFAFQDKAVKFTCVNASAAEPLFRGLFQELSPSLRGCFRRQPVERKALGSGLP